MRAHLERMFALHGKPAFLRADNGREFIAASLVEWLEDQGVKVVFIAKASVAKRQSTNASTERWNENSSHHVRLPLESWRSNTWSTPGPRNTTRCEYIAHLLARPQPRTQRCFNKQVQQTKVVVAIERHYHHTTWTSQNPGRRLHHTTRPAQHPSQALDQKDGAGQNSFGDPALQVNGEDWR